MGSQMREQGETWKHWEGGLETNIIMAFILTYFDLGVLFNGYDSFPSSLFYVRGNTIY